MVAGILLLFKEKLRQLSPPDSEEVLIKKDVVPKLTPAGLVFVGKGKKTADVMDLKVRFHSLGIQVDWHTVDKIVDLRNRLEHYKESATSAEMKKLVVDTFALVSAFITNELKEQPVALLGEETWSVLLAEAAVYAQEKQECERRMANIKWQLPALNRLAEKFCCPQCGSDLLRPIDTTAADQQDLAFTCIGCGDQSGFSDLIEDACEEVYGTENYLAATDGGEPATTSCHECFLETFVLSESVCVHCSATISHSKCVVCGEALGPAEHDFGGLCGYHHHQWEKDD